MSSISRFIVLLSVFAMIGAPTLAMAQDSSAAVEQRVNSILKEMTLDEKIGMVNGNFGSILKKTRSNDERIGAGYVPGVPRLGIPDLYESDGSVGVSNGGSMRPGDVATAMPSGLALAASFDPALAEKAGSVIGAEARAKGFNVMLAGGANLIRDAWGGRNFEYLSEDVLLTGEMAGAQIRGIQSNKIISTIKHYALNPQETGRYVIDARIDEAALRESDLLAFQLAMERGKPGSVMCGYNKINGDWACENDFLLNVVLKRDWSFHGWVMSDWGAVHSTEKSAIAGLDQQSGQELDKAPYFSMPLKASVQSGGVPATRLDDMVSRILRMMITHGLIDSPAPSTPQSIDYLKNSSITQKIAESGIVLLKNDSALLPIALTAKRIVVIGGHADIGVLSGGGSSQVQGFSGTPLRLPMPNAPANLAFIKISYHGSSPLAAIRSRLPNADVAFLDGQDPAAAAKAAKDADLVFVFAEQWRTETSDLETLALGNGQNELIKTIAIANPRTVVILQTGGAVLMPWIDNVAAVLAAWYPGDRGGEAIARVLFGEVDASGRLPITFPVSDAQAPRPKIPGLEAVKAAAAAEKDKPPTAGATTIDLSGGVQSFPVLYSEGANVGYRWFESETQSPLFPFGYGLSYTRFDYSNLNVKGGKCPQIRFTVTNRGTREGKDTPQLYAAVADSTGKITRRLIGFQRVLLAPGESKTVTLKLETRLLAHYDAALQKWRLSKNPIALSLGRNANDIVLTGALKIPAFTIKP